MLLEYGYTHEFMFEVKCVRFYIVTKLNAILQ